MIWTGADSAAPAPVGSEHLMLAVAPPAPSSVRRTGPLRVPDRWLAAVCLLMCAGAHVPLVAEHLDEAPYAGVAFILLITAASILATLLVLRDTALVWAGVAGLAGLAVVAYLVSRTVGLPQLGDDRGSWTDPLSFPALASELLALVVAVGVLAALVSPGPRSSDRTASPGRGPGRHGRAASSSCRRRSPARRRR